MSALVSVTDISAFLLTWIGSISRRVDTWRSEFLEILKPQAAFPAETANRVKNALFGPLLAASRYGHWFKVMSVVCGPPVALVEFKFGPAAFPRSVPR